MKKYISLALVLVLTLTAAAAFAESPSTDNQFGVGVEEIYSRTPGVVVVDLPAETENLANRLIVGGDLGRDVYGKSFMNDADAGFLSTKNLTNVTLIPMPTITVSDSVVVAFAEIVVPVPAAIAEYLLKNIDNIIALYSYQKTEGDEIVFYTSALSFVVEKTGARSYAVVLQIPVSFLRAAQGWPTILDFELVK